MIFKIIVILLSCGILYNCTQISYKQDVSEYIISEKNESLGTCGETTCTKFSFVASNVFHEVDESIYRTKKIGDVYEIEHASEDDLYHISLCLLFLFFIGLSIFGKYESNKLDKLVNRVAKEAIQRDRKK